MQFEIEYDGDGQPTRVHKSDGFMQSSGKFDPEEDGWMLDQIPESEFPIIKMADQLSALLADRNRLARENWNLRSQLKLWKEAAGFLG